MWQIFAMCKKTRETVDKTKMLYVWQIFSHVWQISQNDYVYKPILQTERRNVWQILAMCGKIARMIMSTNQFCRQREEMCGKM